MIYHKQKSSESFGLVYISYQAAFDSGMEPGQGRGGRGESNAEKCASQERIVGT